MWYEALFPFSIYVTILSLPNIVMPMYEQWMTKNRYLKDTDDYHIKRFWLRDLYLTGQGFEATGIDAIPDLPETKRAT